MNEHALPGELAANFFDGEHASAHPVRLHIRDGRLHIEGEAIQRTVALAEVQWPERTRHGMRMLHLADGSSIQCSDSAAWDQWSATEGGRSDGWVVRTQQRWGLVLASLSAL
ncbi:MAG: hypothetical protein JO370_08715, partial [Paucibacter sp.]|nr:hypothetical protein [Roseateles sp.]